MFRQNFPGVPGGMKFFIGLTDYPGGDREFEWLHTYNGEEKSLPTQPRWGRFPNPDVRAPTGGILTGPAHLIQEPRVPEYYEEERCAAIYNFGTSLQEKWISTSCDRKLYSVCKLKLNKLIRKVKIINYFKMSQVGIIMGSTSDLPIMQEAIDILAGFDIETEVDIVSAHRTPEKLFEYGKTAHERGIKVIIAGAGGAAHLPGMVASLSPLPVIGVPVKSSNSIDGWDSILSILQMPGGVPVARERDGGEPSCGRAPAPLGGAVHGPSGGSSEGVVRVPRGGEPGREGAGGRA